MAISGSYRTLLSSVLAALVLAGVLMVVPFVGVSDQINATTEASTAGRINVTTKATTGATVNTTTDMSTVISTIQITVATTESSSTATTEQTAEATTQSSTGASTQPTTQASIRASTAASTQATTRPTIQATARPTTQATIRNTTQATTRNTSQAITRNTTRATTRNTTQAITRPTTQATTRNTTRATTRNTTQASTRPSTRASTRPTTPATTVPMKIAFNIRLDKYSNPTNKMQNGKNCDPWDACDPFFKILYKLSSAGGAILKQDEITTLKTDNVGEIVFSTGKALGFTNPIQGTAFNGTKVSVEVKAYDDDSPLANELIGVFEFNYLIGAPKNSSSRVSGKATFSLTFF